MRILLDEEELTWDAAWAIVTNTFFFTNHTVLPVRTPSTTMTAQPGTDRSALFNCCFLFHVFRKPLRCVIRYLHAGTRLLTFGI